MKKITLFLILGIFIIPELIIAQVDTAFTYHDKQSTVVHEMYLQTPQGIKEGFYLSYY